MSTTDHAQAELATPGKGMNPLWVGLAILFFFPVGLFLLWRHPTLSRNKTWWWVGGIWSFLVLVAGMSDDKEKKPTADTPVVIQAPADSRIEDNKNKKSSRDETAVADTVGAAGDKVSISPESGSTNHNKLLAWKKPSRDETAVADTVGAAGDKVSISPESGSTNHNKLLAWTKLIGRLTNSQLGDDPSRKQREAYMKEVMDLVKGFEAIPFDAAKNPGDAKQMLTQFKVLWPVAVKNPSGFASLMLISIKKEMEDMRKQYDER
jgi:hypothetical protein